MTDSFSTGSAEPEPFPDVPDWERWATAIADGAASFPFDAPMSTQQRLAVLVARQRRRRLLCYLARLAAAAPSSARNSG